MAKVNFSIFFFQTKSVVLQLEIKYTTYEEIVFRGKNRKWYEMPLIKNKMSYLEVFIPEFIFRGFKINK